MAKGTFSSKVGKGYVKSMLDKRYRVSKKTTFSTTISGTKCFFLTLYIQVEDKQMVPSGPGFTTNMKLNIKAAGVG